MLCSIGDFVFNSSHVNLSNIKRKMQYDYTNTKTINSFEQWQAVGQFSKTLTLNGKLIKQSNNSLDELEAIAERKEAVTLAFEDGRALSVVIREINTDRSSLLNNGAFLVQEFDISLGVVYGSFTNS